MTSEQFKQTALKWSELDPNQRGAIVAATTHRTGKRISKQARQRMILGDWEQISLADQDLLFGTDWQAALAPKRNPKSGKTPKMFVLYDGRAVYEDTDDCSVMDTASTEGEARASGEDLWKDYDAIWAEYDLMPDGSYGNETLRYDLPPQKGLP
jgi:hypothetical protein